MFGSGPRLTSAPGVVVGAGPEDVAGDAVGLVVTLAVLVAGANASATVGIAEGLAAFHEPTSAGVIGSEADHGNPPDCGADAFQAAFAIAARYLQTVVPSLTAFPPTLRNRGKHTRN